MRFPISPELQQRLPRHPDWRYERVDGQAWLSPRPRPLHLRRPTALPVPGSHAEAEVRAIDPDRDLAAVARLLLEVWPDEDPYRSLPDPAEGLRREIERGIETASLGAVVADTGGRARAAVLVHPWDGMPALSWLTVAREDRERGLATALLRHVIATVRAGGASELTSSVSAANIPSLRWHLSRGFELAPDPIRVAQRGLGGGRTEDDAV